MLVRENISFERGLGSRRSLEVGEERSERVKFRNIPPSLIDEYGETYFESPTGTDEIRQNPDGTVSLYRYNISKERFEPIWNWEIDDFIKELVDFEGGDHYYYDEKTYKWEKSGWGDLETYESMEFQRGQGVKNL